MYQTIADLWKYDKETIENKSLGQILSFCGEGKLKDNNQTCLEMREYFNLLPTSKLERYIEECLQQSFDGSGFALQDLVNELGRRLGFDVIDGLYRGNKCSIGNDGLWKSDDHDIVVEVKTTDAYSININTIADYRKKLIAKGEIRADDASSILMVVGRQDTGVLEAQIRGSKHAWDMRLISIDAIIKLLHLKEDLLDDETSFAKICQILKPLEFTRLDSLIETIFTTGKDAQSSDNMQDDNDGIETILDGNVPKPVEFHGDCIEKIEKYLNIVLKKQTKTLYDNKEKNIGLTCAVSKKHDKKSNSLYWFAFHPYQQDSLNKYREAYVCFGCGDSNHVFMFPFKEFVTYLDKMWMTNNETRKYWHIHIRQQGNRYLLARSDKEHIDITDKLIPPN